MKVHRSLLSLALLAATFSATAATSVEQGDPSGKIREAVRLVKETAVVKSIKDVPGTGLKEVVADSSVIYMDPNGNYLFFGTLLDMKNKVNLTEQSMASARTGALQSIPEAEKIVLRAPNERYRVTVFTDTSCGYCKLLHENEAGYAQRGITIEYVAFPRGGTQSEAFPVMRQVWCSKDRAAAYKLAIEGKPIPQPADCADPVGKHYAIGDGMAIEGTPAIFTADGKQLGGFLPPEELEAKLKAGKSNEDLASAE